MKLSRVEYVLKAEDTVFNIEARIDGLRVARASCVRTGDCLLLGDISLEKDVSPPWPILHSFLISHFRPRRPWKLERRGIGTTLLKRLLQEAVAADIHEIKGSVMPDAIATQPWLLPWYEKHGFAVTEPEDDDEECLNGASKMVIRRF